MFAHIGYRNIRAMLGAAIIAMVLISLILIAALRSLKYGLLSLLPNLMPVGAAFGIWALVDGEVGLALSVVAGVTLGIVVDDTIHFMSKYLRALREQKLSPQAAVRYAFHSVGVALLVTTIVLAAGFFILALSHFKVNADMGIMTALTIIIALIIDFLFLPPLLMQFEPQTQSSDVKQLEEQPA
jgi:predicted RND superfamily exporter protein